MGSEFAAKVIAPALELAEPAPAGEGAFSKVFKCRSTADGRALAVKIVDLARLSPEDRENLQREIAIHRRLSHEHIIGFVEAFHSGETVNVVLEFAENRSLFAYVHPWKGLPEALALRFFHQTARALRYLHQRGVLHRDVKPENVLLDGRFDAKLCDFGWACEGDGRPRRGLCGTFEYMSPEMLAGEPHDAKSDVWSLGILLYEMLFGSPPYRANSLAEMQRQMNARIITFDSRVSAATEDLLRQMLDKRPRERPDLERVLAHPAVAARLAEFRRPIAEADFDAMMKNFKGVFRPGFVPPARPVVPPPLPAAHSGAPPLYPSTAIAHRDRPEPLPAPIDTFRNLAAEVGQPEPADNHNTLFNHKPPERRALYKPPPPIAYPRKKNGDLFLSLYVPEEGQPGEDGEARGLSGARTPDFNSAAAQITFRQPDKLRSTLRNKASDASQPQLWPAASLSDGGAAGRSLAGEGLGGNRSDRAEPAPPRPGPPEPARQSQSVEPARRATLFNAREGQQRSGRNAQPRCQSVEPAAEAPPAWQSGSAVVRRVGVALERRPATSRSIWTTEHTKIRRSSRISVDDCRSSFVQL